MKQNIISVQVDDGDGGLATIELYKNGSNKHVIEETAEIIDLIAGGRFKAIVGEHTYLFRPDGKIQIDGKDLQRSNGFYYTSTAPTLVSGSTYRIATANILGGGVAMPLNEINSDGYMLKVGDMVVYYADGKIRNLYFVAGYASEGYVDLLLLGVTGVQTRELLTTAPTFGATSIQNLRLLTDNNNWVEILGYIRRNDTPPVACYYFSIKAKPRAVDDPNPLTNRGAHWCFWMGGDTMILDVTVDIITRSSWDHTELGINHHCYDFTAGNANATLDYDVQILSVKELINY